MSGRLSVFTLSAMTALSVIADMRMGVCSHLTRTGFREREALCAKMASAGFTSVRTDFDWRTIERKDGTWDFSRTDAVVETATRHGLTVLPILAGEPSGIKVWQDTAAWSNFVARTVAHYRGRIPAYEIWNEPNTESFWHHPTNAANYLAALRVAASAARAADPNCRIVFGGLSKVPLDFVDEIYRLGGRDTFDVLAIHPYDIFHLPENRLEKDLVALRALMTRHGDGDKPIWITELGWPSGVGKDARPPFDRLKWSENDQAAFAARSLAIAKRCGIAAFYWYEFRSHDYDRGESHWGMVHSDLSEKPAFKVFAKCPTPGLAAGFANPPRDNRPQVWWWTSELASAPNAAIVRDLEAMKAVGLSAFHIYGGSATNAKWLEKAVFAIDEATRVGLDVYLVVGVAGCGHPDTPLCHAPKDIVFTSVTAKAENGVLKAALPRKGKKSTPTDADGRPSLYTDIVTLAIPTRTNVALDDVRDVSACLDVNRDVLTWNGAPDGNWTILRAAWVPLKFGWSGCYIDHLSRAAMDDHWNRVVTPLLKRISSANRKTLKGVVCDSWEAGTTSWTSEFATEFAKRRGYELTKWIAALAGLDVGKPNARKRFLRDYQQTISELLADNHYGYKTELAHREGLVHIAEACGPHQSLGDVRMMQGRCDVAMGEFWMPSAHRPTDPQRFMLRDAASAAHVYGLREVLAESFTTINTYWTEAPSDLKPCADRAFCDGLTRVCYHGMMLSPSLTDRPGKIRSAAQHYNPQNTWFYQSRALNDYLSRCSWMLSRGRFVADALVYGGDAINLFASLKDPSDALGVGYDYDYCPTELLVKAQAEDGEVLLPSGMRYRALVLSDKNPAAKKMGTGKLSVTNSVAPYVPFVSSEAEKALRRLEEGGAAVLRTRAERVEWTRRNLPDFAAEPAQGVDWIHRVTEHEDIYFVANQISSPREFSVMVRARRNVVELWDAVTGERHRAVSREMEDGRTRVELSLPANGSVFVVLADQASQGLVESARQELAEEIRGNWRVRFDGLSAEHEINGLGDWSKSEIEPIRHYSGTAAYRTTVKIAPRPDERVFLDLGEVRSVAEVFVNDIPCGIAWTSPFKVDITEALKGRKVAKIEVRVTNLWPNRLIGDAALPNKLRVSRTNMNPYKPTDPLLPSGLLGPVNLLRSASFFIPERD